jgi:hypothetical protein
MSDSNGTRALTVGSGNLVTLTFIVFLVLKLTGVITWSWWWITAPIWAGFVLVGGILLLIVLVGFMVFLTERR